MPPELFRPEIVIIDGLYLMPPKRKPMRDFAADRMILVEFPVMFHHQHDVGVSDLHIGRFAVQFALFRPDADWGKEVVDWATDNCAGPFELQDVAPAEWSFRMNCSPQEYDRNKPAWERALLFAQESDATLTYLRFK